MCARTCVVVLFAHLSFSSDIFVTRVTLHLAQVTEKVSHFSNLFRDFWDSAQCLFIFFLIFRNCCFCVSSTRHLPAPTHPHPQDPLPDTLPQTPFRRTPLRRTAQNFTPCALSLNFGGVEGQGAPKCTFGLSGSSCQTPAVPPDRAAGARTR